MSILLSNNARKLSLLIILISAFQLAVAQVAQQPKSRDVLVKESIAKLDEDDIHVAAQAALDLGRLRAREAVPAMLRVLESSRVLTLTEHVMAKDENGLSEYLLTDVKGEIINSLGIIGDQRAVPVLKKYLLKPPRQSQVFGGNVAHALYQLTGKSYSYKGYDGEVKRFVPSAKAREDFEKRLPPQEPSRLFPITFEINGKKVDTDLTLRIRQDGKLFEVKYVSSEPLALPKLKPGKRFDLWIVTDTYTFPFEDMHPDAFKVAGWRIGFDSPPYDLEYMELRLISPGVKFVYYLIYQHADGGVTPMFFESHPPLDWYRNITTTPNKP
ncbi:MAG TPA: hypothetical protein VLL54_15915 [Pyrinomonadaceae bacterium]|nr:hypothetical protein [Pyrinomonadaceae bacterium]